MFSSCNFYFSFFLPTNTKPVGVNTEASKCKWSHCYCHHSY